MSMPEIKITMTPPGRDRETRRLRMSEIKVDYDREANKLVGCSFPEAIGMQGVSSVLLTWWAAGVQEKVQPRETPAELARWMTLGTLNAADVEIDIIGGDDDDTEGGENPT